MREIIKMITSLFHKQDKGKEVLFKYMYGEDSSWQYGVLKKDPIYVCGFSITHKTGKASLMNIGDIVIL